MLLFLVSVHILLFGISLYKYLSPTSDKIECLFLERAKQLLKENGIIGVIVPRSLLTTTDEINSNTREFLLENFENLDQEHMHFLSTECQFP